MAFEKYSEKQLKKLKQVCLIVSITMLALMCFALGYGLYQIGQGEKSNLLFLVPTVFGPLTFIPIIISSIIETALKKR